jgi:hypothetical protein
MEEALSDTGNDALRWLPMRSAPKDGSRILVTVRPAEQGEAEVDTVSWSAADDAAGEGWRSADSRPGAVIDYAESELKCWMPVPGADAAAPRPPPFAGEEVEVDGSGI